MMHVKISFLDEMIIFKTIAMEMYGEAEMACNNHAWQSADKVQLNV